MDQGNLPLAGAVLLLVTVIGVGLYAEYTREKMRASGELRTPAERRRMVAARYGR